MPELPPDSAFLGALQDLESRMRSQAAKDGDVFIQNPQPDRPVDYVFICMEPSLGRWAQKPDELAARVEAGSCNFVNSLEDFLFHFSVRKYLCVDGERYARPGKSVSEPGSGLPEPEHRDRS